MLQVILTLFIFLFSTAAIAQPQYQDEDVPAFLKQEAQQGQYGVVPGSMQGQQPASAVPAFMMNAEERMQMQQQQQIQQQQQMLQQQNQYNYQSADPNSGVFTLPPAVYQPAPGDVPAFIQNGDNQPAQAEKVNFQANKKEDTIQINFSEDQYKAEQDEVTPLNQEQAKKYNTEVETQNSQGTGESTEEIPEGARFEGQNKTTEGNAPVTQEQTNAQNAAEEKQAMQETVPEPVKATTNMLRVSYSKEGIDLTEKDKSALLPVVRLLKSNKQQKILLKAYTSERDLGADPRKVGLMRIIGVREFLMKQGVNFSQTDVRVIEPELNKEDLDYIDIDKI